MSNDALVTVIVPVFNAEKYIDQCLRSLVEQSYQNMEILVLDDGSIDGTLERIQFWALKDDRIRIISRENKGLIATLNELIAKSRGQFIARMDADDYCHVDRIRLQVAALGGDLALVGSNCLVVDDESKVVGQFRFEEKHSNIEVDGFFRVQFCHSSVMFDLNKIHLDDIRDDSEYPHAEDLELWFRLLKKYQCGNLNRNLLCVRRGHATNVSTVHAKAQLDTTVKILVRYAGIPISNVDILSLRQRNHLLSLASSGFRVGSSLYRRSVLKGSLFFKKLLLILLVAIARRAAALLKGQF